MSDPNTYRQSAAECLKAAISATEQSARTELVILASKFLELASRTADGDNTLRDLLDEFNAAQMRT